MIYTREKLIELCERAVVHHSKWENRDSYSAQVLISSIYEGLTAGLEFEINNQTDDYTIWIDFINVEKDMLKNSRCLSICGREEYFENCDPDYETEMFIGYGIDFNSNYTGGYMPTEKRLNNAEGDDWY